jgi:hypothetical protein
MDDEIPRYRKKRGSSISQSERKANHKHEGINCLYVCDGKPHKGVYCKICGKVMNVEFLLLEKREDGSRRMLSDAEIFERYSNLERKELKDFRQRYVD